MLSEIVDYLVTKITELDWIAVVIGVLIETIIVPIPSPVIPMAAGFALLEGSQGIEALFILGVKIGFAGGLTATLANIPFYYLGKLGGIPIIERFSRYIGIEVDELNKAISILGGKSWLQIVIYRAIPIMPLSLVSIASGILEYDFKGYLTSTLVGSIPRYLILGYLGWITRDLYIRLAYTLDNAETALIILITIGLIGYIIVKKLIKR
ncbi:TPA: hypothetical protein EYP83_04285 [Candidatus Geothermarchaeota archaeon]|nr:hypothetical protein [Candidatus Geothermarchaeota archaeon]HIQ13821.1 hypothetical protein [Thermoprotei archaeon]